jgi:5-methyltetrahydrofolate--homocysteine methyltransferase
MSRFLDALHSGRVLLMDGAMGTELQKVGLRDDENGAAWNLLHPEQVEAVHRAYLRAGAEVLLTNTFLINAASYSTQLWAADVIPAFPTGWCEALARVGSGGRFRLGAVGPVSGGAVREFDDLNRWRAPNRNCYNHRHGEHLLPDAVLVETCSTPRVRYIMQRYRRWHDLPVLLSFTFLRDDLGKLITFSGHSPEWFARRAGDYGVAALGVNCGRDISMDDVIEIVRRYRAVTDLPIFARPNAGTPTRDGDRWVYPLTPKAMAARLPELLEAGISMVGGCCGTTPKHIAACRPIIDAWNARGAS